MSHDLGLTLDQADHDGLDSLMATVAEMPLAHAKEHTVEAATQSAKAHGLAVFHQQMGKFTDDARHEAKWRLFHAESRFHARMLAAGLARISALGDESTYRKAIVWSVRLLDQAADRGRIRAARNDLIRNGSRVFRKTSASPN